MTPTVTETALPKTDLVESIVTDLFAGQLGVPDPPVPDPDAAAVVAEVVASVSVRGMWEGIVTLGSSSACARTVAGLMFGTEAHELSAADVADAAGELVNIVGGNVKSVMPGPSRLSLPSVSSTPTRVANRSDPAMILPMRWRDELLTVEISSVRRGRETP